MQETLIFYHHKTCTIIIALLFFSYVFILRFYLQKLIYALLHYTVKRTTSIVVLIMFYIYIYMYI